MTNNGYKMIKKCSKGQKAWKKIKKFNEKVTHSITLTWINEFLIALFEWLSFALQNIVLTQIIF